MNELVMLVDDDEDLRTMMALIIGSQGYQTVDAFDGLDALMQLEQGLQPAVIVLDFRMPRMNGAEFLDAIRGTPAGGIPVVALTGDPAAAQDALKSGARLCLRKPVEARALLDAVRAEIAAMTEPRPSA
jgi:CheY-like chemotaxis protein